MKRVRTLLFPALLVLIVGFSGCTALDYATVNVEPNVVHVWQPYTVSLIFTSLEPTTVTVSSIYVEVYFDGEFFNSVTVSSGSSGWITDTVPPFQQVVIFEETGPALAAGSFELRTVFHTSEGDFPATGGWTVLP